MLRANLQYFGIDQELKSILITSSASEDGKTMVAWNLAQTEAHAGKRILYRGGGPAAADPRRAAPSLERKGPQPRARRQPRGQSRDPEGAGRGRAARRPTAAQSRRADRFAAHGEPARLGRARVRSRRRRHAAGRDRRRRPAADQAGGPGAGRRPASPHPPRRRRASARAADDHRGARDRHRRQRGAARRPTTATTARRRSATRSPRCTKSSRPPMPAAQRSRRRRPSRSRRDGATG